MCEDSTRLDLSCGVCGPSWGSLDECQAVCNQLISCTHIAYTSEQGCQAYSSCNVQTASSSAVTIAVYERTKTHLSQNTLGHVSDNIQMNGAHGVAASGSVVYIASQTSDSLSVVDASNAASPVVTGYVSDSIKMNGASGVAVSGMLYAYVACKLSHSVVVIDVSDATSPVVTGSVSDTTTMNGANGIAIMGNFVYVTAENSATLSVVDVSNAASPVVTGYVSDSIKMNGASGVAVSGTFIYVACKLSHSVVVIDVSDATSPVVTGSVSDTTTMNGANGIAIMGNFVYVTAEESDSLTVVDVSSLISPLVVGHVRDSSYMEKASALAVISNHVYVTSPTADLITVIDVSIPTSPQVVGHLTGSNIKGVKGIAVDANVCLTDPPAACDGHLAYVTSYSHASMAVVNISPQASIHYQPTKTATHHTDATWSLGTCTFATCSMYMPSSTMTSITMSWHSIYPTAVTSGNLQYVQTDWNENMCPTSSHHSAISESSACQVAAAAIGVVWRGDTNDATKPKGCMHYGLAKGNTDCGTYCGIFYNEHIVGTRSLTARVVCNVATILEVQLAVCLRINTVVALRTHDSCNSQFRTCLTNLVSFCCHHQSVLLLDLSFCLVNIRAFAEAPTRMAHRYSMLRQGATHSLHSVPPLAHCKMWSLPI